MLIFNKLFKHAMFVIKAIQTVGVRRYANQTLPKYFRLVISLSPTSINHEKIGINVGNIGGAHPKGVNIYYAMS